MRFLHFLWLSTIFATCSLAGENEKAHVAPTATSWPLARGDQQATGVAKSALPEKPQQLWKFEAKKGAFDATPAIVDGVVFVGENDEKFYALKLATGEKIWEASAELGFPGSPAARDGKVFVGDGVGIFHCYAAADGKVLWQFPTESEAEIVAGELLERQGADRLAGFHACIASTRPPARKRGSCRSKTRFARSLRWWRIAAS